MQPQAHVSIVGAWRVDIDGAPFVQHVMLFHGDGTVLVHNPDAGDHTSDSLGVGAWKVDGGRQETVIGTFEEISADRATKQYVNRLVVHFTLTLDGNAFTGPAEGTYYDPKGQQIEPPHQAKLMGSRILP